MKKLTKNNRLESLAYCAFIFLFAIQPVFERIGVSDYVVWVLMLVCIVVALFSFVRRIMTEGGSLYEPACIYKPVQLFRNCVQPTGTCHQLWSQYAAGCLLDSIVYSGHYHLSDT